MEATNVSLLTRGRLFLLFEHVGKNARKTQYMVGVGVGSMGGAARGRGPVVVVVIGCAVIVGGGGGGRDGGIVGGM